MLIKQLDALRVEHRQLDSTIEDLARARPDAEFELVRLKKQKLGLRDKICQLEHMIYPNIPA
ncbi:MAG: YdcH family protein [Rickettsiales bacterium]|nr:YdcH family protein [Rickettsiales bacterium]